MKPERICQSGRFLPGVEITSALIVTALSRPRALRMDSEVICQIWPRFCIDPRGGASCCWKDRERLNEWRSGSRVERFG